MTTLSDPIYSLRAVYEGDVAVYEEDRLGRRRRDVPAKRSMYVSSEEVAVRGERYWGQLVSVGTYRWEGGTWVPVGKVGARRAKDSRRPEARAGGSITEG